MDLDIVTAVVLVGLILLILISTGIIDLSMRSGLADAPAQVAGPAPSSGIAVDQNFMGTTADVGRMADYAEATKLMGLEPDIARSHARFVNELPHRTTTASHESVLTSFNPPVQFYGLPRNALYKQVGSSSNSRTVPTETDAQSIDFALHRSSGYTL